MSLFDLSASTNSRKVPILNADYPHDVTMKATDGNATFTAVIAKDGRPDKYTYQWYVDGAAVSGATAAEYVRNVSIDKGVHTVWCEVSNKAGTVRTREAKLTVKKVPVLNGSYPENVSVHVADSVTFRVSIAEDGYPASYTYQWYVNGAAIIGATSPSYASTATPAGTRNVYCVVTNEAGSVQSRTAMLSVSARYFYSNGIFHYGGSYNWAGNSPTFQDCGIENGLWYLKADAKCFAATWGTVAANLTGISKVIFTVSSVYANGDPNDAEEDIGIARLGVTNSANLGNTAMIAEASFRMYTSGAVEYVIPVDNLSGNYFIKFVIDRTTTRDNQNWIYISAIRFE